MTQTIVARNATVSLFGITGSLRGYITAVALKIRDLYRELTIVRRKLFLNTCSGTDLDTYAEQIGVDPLRRGSSKAGVLLLFTGTSGTVIPLGTRVVCDLTNIGYVTKSQITLGSANPSFITSGAINVATANVGDVVWAECEVGGEIGNVPAHSISVITVANVKVTNPSPAQGGRDLESDQQFRYRIKNYVKLLNKNTQKYYEALCMKYNANVLRVLVEPNPATIDGIIINVLTKSGAPLTASELQQLSAQIYAEQKAFTEVTCINVAFTLITVDERATLKSENGVAVNPEKHYADTAGALAAYFDWSKWEWGGKVSRDNVFVICDTVPQTDDIELESFKINGSTVSSILIPYNSLPYFQALSLTDKSGSTPVLRQNLNITQNYSQQQNIQQED